MLGGSLEVKLTLCFSCGLINNVSPLDIRTATPFLYSTTALPLKSTTNSVSGWSYQSDTCPVLIIRSIRTLPLSANIVVNSSSSGSSGKLNMFIYISSLFRIAEVSTHQQFQFIFAGFGSFLTATARSAASIRAHSSAAI